MSASLSTPWGKFPLPLPGGTSTRFFLRIAGPCGAEIAAPEGASSSRPTSGAARSFVFAATSLSDRRAEGRDARSGLRPAADYFTDEGDLIAVPPFERVAGNRFSAADFAQGGGE